MNHTSMKTPTLCLLLLLLLLSGCKPVIKENTSRVIAIPMNKDLYYIVIPAYIKGIKHNLLLDTGSDLTVINCTPEMRMMLDTNRIKTHTGTIRFYSEDRYGDFYYTNEYLKLEDESILSNIFLHDYKGKEFEPIQSGMAANNLDGVIGMDVLGRYNWYIDFLKNELLLSKYGIEIPDTLNCDTVLKLTVPKGRAMNTKIKLNDTIEHSFLFDTGCLYDSIKIGERVLFNEMVLSDTLLKALDKKYPNYMNIAFDSTALLLVPEIYINESHIHNLAAFDVPGNKKNRNTITAAFLRRLNGMYYDYNKGELSLYINQTAQHNNDVGRVINTILEMVLQRVKEENVSSECPDSSESEADSTNYDYTRYNASTWEGVSLESIFTK